MKKSTILASVSTMAALCATSSALEPAVPVGKLFIDSTVVEPNVVPNLSWQITHPKDITNLVDINKKTDEVKTVTKVVAKVSMIGTGITDQYGKEYSSISEIKFGNNPWQHIFTGPGGAVDPSSVLVQRELEPNTPISFRSRYIGYTKWIDNSSSEVHVLTNGDNPPTNPRSGYNAKTAEEYLQSHTSNGKLTLGSLDLIYAAELTHTDTSLKGYDLQDSIVLVRFSEVKTQVGTPKGEIDLNLNGGKNNGHSDKVDGVDVSNPGQGLAGKNSWTDTDYNGNGVYEENEFKEGVLNGGSTKNNKLSQARSNDWSNYDTSYGRGYQAGGKQKNWKYQRNSYPQSKPTWTRDR